MGEPVSWTNRLVIRNELSETGDGRKVKLFVAPRGSIRYTLDGSEPREGIPYVDAISIGDGDLLIQVFAEAEGLEVKNQFRFPARGKKGVQVDDVLPANLVSLRGGHKLDSRGKTFEALQQAAAASATFEGVGLTVGQGNRMISITIGEVPVDATFLESLLSVVTEKFEPDSPVTMTFRKGRFVSGHDLKGFAGKLGIELQVGDVEQ
jgi:hypothetical protein